MRPAGAAIEPGGDAGALEGVLEQAEILARRAQEHRHLVELHALPRFGEDPAGDLDAFAPFARRGEQPDVAALLARRRLARGRRGAPQRREVRVAVGRQRLNLDAEPLQVVERRDVAERHGDERVRRGGNQAARQLELDRRFHRHVEEQQRHRALAATPSLAASNSAARPVAEAAANCSSNPSSSRARSAPPSGRPRRRSAATPAIASSCSVRASARGKPGVPATASKYVELALLARIEGRARRDRLGADERRRRDAAGGEHGRGEPRRELGEAEAMQAGRRALRERHLPRQIVRRAARCRDDERAAMRPRDQPGLRLTQADRGFSAFDDAERGSRGRHLMIASGRRAGLP